MKTDGQENFTLELLVSFVLAVTCWALGQEIVTPKQEEELQIKFTIAKEILFQMDLCGATVISSDKLN